MDLVTLALAMKNGGGGGGGAPLIVPGVRTEVDGYAEVEIETELADIYAAAEAGRAVFLEWKDGGDATTLQLVDREYDDEEETYSLSFGAAIFEGDTPVIVSVRFDDYLTGQLMINRLSDSYDIEIRHNRNRDEWTANEYNLDALQAKQTPISVRAVREYGNQEHLFVWLVTVADNYISVVLIEMDPNVSSQNRIVNLVVFPNGRVIKQ